VNSVGPDPEKGEGGIQTRPFDMKYSTINIGGCGSKNLSPL